MRFPGAVSFALLPLLTQTCRSDSLELKDGTVLRGLDFKAGKKALFTLETGHVLAIDPAQVVAVTPSPKGETVEFRGRAMTLREKIQTLQDERKARLKAAGQDLERWAKGASSSKTAELGDDARLARDRFLALEEDERETALSTALGAVNPKSVRRLAAAELAKHRGARPAGALVQASIRDPAKEIRETAFASLKEVAEPGTGERILPFLTSQQGEERVRAALSLEAFPTQRAVPTLIVELQKVWDDFGRSYFFRGEERAFVHDYNLVSGGTGFSIIEVADPEVSSVKTGVVLDAKIRRVEIHAYARALKAITGQDLGLEPKAWRDWWREKGREAAKK